jgi:molecular chaperone HscB
MNYFELFEIPIKLKVDKGALTGTYFRLSKKYHPDYHVYSQHAEQQNALEKSALLNKAWKTFSDADETIKYVLQIKNLLQEEEKYELPPDFLMEVMEINEQLMEQDAVLKPMLKKRVEELQEEIYKPVKLIVETYRENTHSNEDLFQVKEYYYKKKYLDRISKQLAEMA